MDPDRSLHHQAAVSTLPLSSIAKISLCSLERLFSIVLALLARSSYRWLALLAQQLISMARSARTEVNNNGSLCSHSS